MTTLYDAAATVKAAELDALKAIQTAIEAFETALNSATADLVYPAGYPSYAISLANDIRSSYTYRTGTLASQIASMAPDQSNTPPVS